MTDAASGGSLAETQLRLRAGASAATEYRPAPLDGAGGQLASFALFHTRAMPPSLTVGIATIKQGIAVRFFPF